MTSDSMAASGNHGVAGRVAIRDQVRLEAAGPDAGILDADTAPGWEQPPEARAPEEVQLVLRRPRRVARAPERRAKQPRRQVVEQRKPGVSLDREQPVRRDNE